MTCSVVALSRGCFRFSEFNLHGSFLYFPIKKKRIKRIIYTHWAATADRKGKQERKRGRRWGWVGSGACTTTCRLGLPQQLKASGKPPISADNLLSLDTCCSSSVFLYAPVSVCSVKSESWRFKNLYLNHLFFSSLKLSKTKPESYEQITAFPPSVYSFPQNWQPGCYYRK